MTQAAAWPARSGIGRRTEALLTTLAGEHNVEVIACLPPLEASGAPLDVPYLRLSRPPGGSRAATRMIEAAICGRPLTSAYYRSKELRRRLALALDGADVLVVQGIAGAILARGIQPEERTILDLADADHERIGPLGRSMGWRGLPYRLDVRRVTRWFSRSLDRYAAVCVVSEHDETSYRQLSPKARLVLCPNGCDVRAAPRPDPGGCEVLFLGDLTYRPNSEGLEWFVANVLPGLGGVTLRVVGRGEAPEHERLVHVGFVDDMDVEWARTTSIVVPLFTGGGTRLKVLEALGAGVPVVSTALGVAGLNLVPDKHYVEADDPETMGRAITTLLADDSLRRRLGQQGYELAREQHTWSSCLSDLNEAVRLVPTPASSGRTGRR